MAIAAMIAILSLDGGFFPRMMSERNIGITRLAAVLLVLGLFTNFIFFANKSIPYTASRNFYGAVKVMLEPTMTVLMHGTTVHGFQPVDKQYEFLPDSYYVPTSGVGRSISFEQKLQMKNGPLEQGIRVGILGLGTGSIAAYCRPGDSFNYYEIDPRIVEIARTHFTYLAHCPNLSVHMGDGRLVLQKELHDGKQGQYDVIIADAFTDDTIPAHLLTLQAIQLYFQHVRSDKSIVAIHISNRYLDLAPVLLKIAEKLGLAAKVVTDLGTGNPLANPSQWVLLSKNPGVFDDHIFDDSKFLVPDLSKTPLWTDDHTSLLHVFVWRF
jgi:hypothetical protein